MDTTAGLVGMALLGGIATEALHWYLLARRPKEIEVFRRRPLYWWTTLVMVILGGIMPLLYTVTTPLLAFHLGMATPLILQKLAAAAPEPGVRQGAAPSATLRRFFAW